jgi:hypothetical protein
MIPSCAEHEMSRESGRELPADCRLRASIETTRSRLGLGRKLNPRQVPESMYHESSRPRVTLSFVLSELAMSEIINPWSRPCAR